MSASPDIRLHRLLGGEHLAPLRRRLRRPFERALAQQEITTLRLGSLTAVEHRALAELLGRPQRLASSIQIDIRRLDRTLQESGIAASLAEALERLDGPIIPRAQARLDAEASWSALVESCTEPRLGMLLRTPQGLGLLKRLTGSDPQAAAELCRAVAGVLAALPAEGTTRSRLAADLLGDAHGLDNGRPAATLVIAALRQIAVPQLRVVDAAPPEAAGTVHSSDEGENPAEGDGESVRELWARAGVLVNELARPALFLNLLSHGGGSPWHGNTGAPAYASLRALLRAPPAWDVRGRDVYVCENPGLIAIAADALAAHCAPMVCTDGMPAAAQRTLLGQLVRAGARLNYHGDFDWPGLRIASHVLRAYGARPWRMGAMDYEAAVRTAPRPGLVLSGPEANAEWDPALPAAMRMHSLAIAEENLAATLLVDLGG